MATRAALRIGLSALTALFAACGLASDGRRDQTDVHGDRNGEVTIVGMGSISDHVLDEGAPDDEAQQAPVSEGEVGVGVGVGDDVGAGGAEPANMPESVCPPLGTDAYGCLPGPTWARELQTGTCCEYASYPGRCTPPGWPLFSSEAECQTSCRCAEVLPAFPEEPEIDLTVERISLACGCAGVFSCPENLAAATARLCEAAGNSGVLRKKKCGAVQLSMGGAFSGSSYWFDAESGALIGATASSDTPRPPCGSFLTIAGRDFRSCTEPGSSCVLCGAPFGGDNLAPCE